MFRLTIIVCAALGLSLAVVLAQPYAQEPSSPTRKTTRKDTVPVVPSHFAKTTPILKDVTAGVPTAWGKETRTIDGVGNNVANPYWGSVGEQLVRLVPPEYGDGYWSPGGTDRPSARWVSNITCTQTGDYFSAARGSDFVWQWGQFLDHDIDLTPVLQPADYFNVAVPSGDAFFDPKGTGTVTIELERSAYDYATGTDPSNPRQQINLISAFIDASNVYGSDGGRAFYLRPVDGTGRMRTSDGDLLPYNTVGLPNAGGTSGTLFIAGDVRVNEQSALTAMHTLFVREHNRLADAFRSADPGLSGEEIYQRSRAVVGGLIQAITYNEFLPLLLGENAIPPYTGYDASVRPSISNLFATASYRLGHSMISSHIQRLRETRDAIPDGHLPLRDAFFTPSRIEDEGGIDPILRGLAWQVMQEVDLLIVDDLRNFLFGPPGSGGLDLASLNIQRGRDHGLPCYTQVRTTLGLSPITTFDDITSDPVRSAQLLLAYGEVDKVDLWAGSLAEDHVEGAMVGQLLHTVLADQFQRLRDGDRFWYQNFFSGSLLAEIENTTLADVIRRNTDISFEIDDNVFVVPLGPLVPAVSQWGVVVLALLLLVGGTLGAARRRRTA